MRKTVIGMAVVVMACVVAAQATVVEIQGPTLVQDAGLVKSTSYFPLLGDQNYGVTDPLRLNPDTAAFPVNGKHGPRHAVFQFDTSFFDEVPNPQVTSAKFRFYIHPNDTLATTKPPQDYIDMKLSRFLAGKDWIEGTKDSATASAGEVTWNSQKHSSSPAWAAAGGTGTNTDIDSASTKTFTIAKAAYKGELRMIEIDVTDFAQAWADGTENNGMNIWGGSTTGTVDGSINWNIIASEDLGGETWYLPGGATVVTTLANRPTLTIDYTPEPASALLLTLSLVPMLRRRRSA